MSLGRTLLVLLVLLTACAPEDPTGANVVVIGIDTLRPDHLGAYGYPRPTSPRIDAFARDAVRFQTAVSQAPWTLPSFASMFTGLVPSNHGAGRGRPGDVTALDERHDTLATVLAAAGYETASFVSNVWVGPDVGMGRGFGRHEQLPFSEEAFTRALAWLHEPHRKPFFLFVHSMDPHQPWAPTEDDAKLFVDPTYTGPIGRLFVGQASAQWNDADRRRVVDLYDGEIRWADRLTGRVLDALDELGLAKRTIVVVVSDHGEELFDHHGLGHGHTLYDELLLVPFLIRFPGGRWSGSVAQAVRTMDLFPTILDAVGLPIPSGLNGKSLMPLLRGGAIPKTDVALSQYPYFASDISAQSLRTPRQKLIFHRIDGRAELYDLTTDPHETTDVAATRQADVAALRSIMLAEGPAVQPGFRLAVRGTTRDSVARARIETPATFRHVTLLGAERRDRFRLGRGGKRIDLKLHLTPVLLGKNPQPDVDRLAFQTDADTPFVLRRLELDGAPIPLDTVSLGNGPPTGELRRLPVTLGTATRHLLVPYPMPPAGRMDSRASVRLTFVRPIAEPKVVVTPEMEQQLRAMGYLQ